MDAGNANPTLELEADALVVAFEELEAFSELLKELEDVGGILDELEL